MTFDNAASMMRVLNSSHQLPVIYKTAVPNVTIPSTATYDLQGQQMLPTSMVLEELLPIQQEQIITIRLIMEQ